MKQLQVDLHPCILTEMEHFVDIEGNKTPASGLTPFAF